MGIPLNNGQTGAQGPTIMKPQRETNADLKFIMCRSKFDINITVIQFIHKG